MIAQYVISFREAFEISLIVGIILIYLSKTSQMDVKSKFWMGIWVAILASVIVGLVVWGLFGELPEETITLFEGIAAILAVMVLTSMILWMSFKGRYLREELEAKVDQAILKGSAFAFFALAFIVVFREGFETVLFLLPFGINDASSTLIGAVLGIMTALLIGYFLFKFGMKIELKRIFYFTSILLILLASGILGYGVHELIEHQEAIGANPGWFGITAYDLGLSSDDLLHHKGAIGSVFAALFGYASSMEWGRLILQIAYLAIFLPVTVIAYRRPEVFDFLLRRRKISSTEIAVKTEIEKETDVNSKISMTSDRK
ncbi:MAG: FTR1 family protein [Thermoplasmata archaeon]|nr:FTR1 family protein [Thermoplasmata archaeon]